MLLSGCWAGGRKIAARINMNSGIERGSPGEDLPVGWLN